MRLVLAGLLALTACRVPRAAPPVESTDASEYDGAPASEPVQRAWPVMGTMLHAAVWDMPEPAAVEVLHAIRDEVRLVDSLMSNYRDDSDVSRLNRAAGNGEWIPIHEHTAAVLRVALIHAEATAGAFDPTVGPIVDVWGFYRESGAMPPTSALDSARGLVGWDEIGLNAGQHAARLPRAGMRLDFGAIAKGYAVDLALMAARDAGARRVMVDLGGNIGVAGRAPGGEDWTLGLRHPREPETSFAVIDAPPGSFVATSGDYERYFMHDGVRYAHIVDPRTGWPVQGVASVSVLAVTGIASDVLSTSLFVLGVDEGCAFVAPMAGVAAVWVLAPEREGDPLRVVVGGAEAARIGIAEGIDAQVCPGTDG